MMAADLRQIRRAAWFLGMACHFCGQPISDPSQAAAHHLDPRAKESHRVWYWADDRREAELAKCVPAHATCHNQHHASLKRRPIPCGTATGYRRGCRCPACRQAHTLAMRAYKANTVQAY